MYLLISVLFVDFSQAYSTSQQYFSLEKQHQSVQTSISTDQQRRENLRLTVWGTRVVRGISALAPQNLLENAWFTERVSDKTSSLVLVLSCFILLIIRPLISLLLRSTVVFYFINPAVRRGRRAANGVRVRRSRSWREERAGGGRQQQLSNRDQVAHVRR